MARHRFIRLIRDLIQVLPQRSREDWVQLDSVTASQPTVILVSGFGATERALTVIRRRLLQDGFNVLVLSMDWQTLSDGFRGLYRMAEKLSSLVLSLRKDGGLGKSKIYLVAHSAGGLVARYYVQRLGGSYYCDGLVTLATPHRGTWLAALGFVTHLILKARCVFQMLPIAPFIRNMNAAEFPRGFPMVSIFSKDDLMCPESATRLPPSLLERPEIETVVLPGLSHSDFLLSKSMYRVLLNRLRQAPPTPVVARSDSDEAVFGRRGSK